MRLIRFKWFLKIIMLKHNKWKHQYQFRDFNLKEQVAMHNNKINMKYLPSAMMRKNLNKLDRMLRNHLIISLSKNYLMICYTRLKKEDNHIRHLKIKESHHLSNQIIFLQMIISRCPYTFNLKIRINQLEMSIYYQQ